jgi:hypothetical protein
MATPSPAIPPPELQSAVRKLISDLGPTRAAKRLQMDRSTMLSLAAGAPCRRATIFQATALASPDPKAAAE